MNYYKAKFIKGLPRENVKNMPGYPIQCLLNNGAFARVFCKKGTCILITEDEYGVPSAMKHWRVFFYDGRVLRMAEEACKFYISTERAGGKVLVDRKMGPILAERFEQALGPKHLAEVEVKSELRENEHGERKEV